MKVFSAILLSLFTIASCSVMDDEASRELFLVDTSQEGEAISTSYQEQGYTKSLSMECEFRLKGTPASRLAGDRSMYKLSKIVKKRFNTVIRRIAKGKYGAEGRSLAQSGDFFMLGAEVELLQALLSAEDVVKEKGNAIVENGEEEDDGLDFATRKLSSEERELIVYSPAYLYGRLIKNMVCRSCYGDTGDQRRLTNAVLAQADYVELILKDLKNSDIPLFVDAVDTANCFELKCNDSGWIGTEGC